MDKEEAKHKVREGEKPKKKKKNQQRQETGEMGTQEGDADGGGGHQERNRFQSCCGGRTRIEQQPGCGEEK